VETGTSRTEEIIATRVLLKFCEDHRYQVEGVNTLRSCLSALEQNDIALAVDCFHRIPLGGMGCFNDWLPPVVFPNEDSEYVAATFEALIARWALMMRSLHMAVDENR
jgi:hypothetical protein